jgi:hypothetical protein
MIEQAHVELPLSLLQPPTAPPAAGNAAASGSGNAIPVVPVKKENKKKYHLSTTTDPLFAELRDLNFAAIGKKLNKVARRLDEDYKVGSFVHKIRAGLTSSKTNLSTKTVAQLRDFVGKLGGLQTEHQALRLRESCFHDYDRRVT